MTKARDRALSIIELLARSAQGLPLIEISRQLDIPRSATHRLLVDLKESGYITQNGDSQFYFLTGKLVSLVSAYLVSAGVTNLMQPILDRLAGASGELVRLASIGGERLTWVARSQGAGLGLRYDPSDGVEPSLAATANGHAWLSCLDDDTALEMIVRQGFNRANHGPRAPGSFQEVLALIGQTRQRGYSIMSETNEAGTSTVAVAIFLPGTRDPLGVVSVTGPTVRLTQERMEELVPALSETARELSEVCSVSPLFGSSRGPTSST